MPTNDEIIDREEMEWIVPDDVDGREVLNRMLNKARADQKAWDNAQEEEYTEIAKRQSRADTANKHTGAIWNWWNTKPQKRKNDETIRIITRTDIEELIKMIK